MAKVPIEIECPHPTCKAKEGEFCTNGDGSRRQLGFHKVRVEFAKRIGEPIPKQAKGGLISVELHRLNALERAHGSSRRRGKRGPKKVPIDSV